MLPADAPTVENFWLRQWILHVEKWRVRGKKVLTLIFITNEIFAAIECYEQDEHYGIGRSVPTAAVAENKPL